MSDTRRIGQRVQVAARIMLVWLLLILAEVIHGITRAVVLVPWMGEFRSNQIGVFTGSAIILAIAYVSVPWIGATRPAVLLLTGATWLILTLGFELTFGRFALGLSWERLASDYNLLDGGLLPLGLFFLLLSPWLAAKLRNNQRAKAAAET